MCRKGDNEDLLLLCDGCDKGCHTYCHKPKITSIPEGDWYCPACISKVSKTLVIYCHLSAVDHLTLNNLTRVWLYILHLKHARRCAFRIQENSCGTPGFGYYGVRTSIPVFLYFKQEDTPNIRECNNEEGNMKSPLL